MPKQTLFDEDSEEEVAIKTENEYAKKYDTWREKEEIHKLEQKYGSKALNSDASISSDSEDESEEPLEISEEVEEQFLKTLSLLKTKDPRIYDPSYKFFEEKQKEEVKEEKKKTLTFEDSDDDGDGDGNIFSIEKKAEIDDETPTTDKNTARKVGKDGKLKDYLIGKVEHIDDPVEKDLAPLKALWSDPALNESEAFLRDYILNKRYLEEGDAGEAEDKLRDDDDLEADEMTVTEQGKFERAYNFRFEEPDQEYLKRFPRTMNYIRPKDDKRSRKRAEVRDRKEEEKRRKMEEIARLKALKLKEIQEKIARIKEVTGNQELAFKDVDIEGDFDPEEHDKRMKAIFDEQYYGDADDEKPVFPDLDEELEIENWDNYDTENVQQEEEANNEDGPHCEDAEFNMDADYDPKQARATLLQEIQSTLGKKRRNRKKKSKLAKLLSSEKPKFIPGEEEKTYDQYMEEYYKMDCEDVIGGDLPTRFKYREVVPNDYGLTVEEILLADDKELTQWVPLKKLVKHCPESVQKSEVNTYKQKAADVALKRKMLPSLFKEIPEEPELVVAKQIKKKKKKKNKKTESVADNAQENEINDSANNENNSEIIDTKSKKKKKSKETQNVLNGTKENEISDSNEINEAKTKKKNKNKKDQSIVDNTQENVSVDINTEVNSETVSEDKRKKKVKNQSIQDKNAVDVETDTKIEIIPIKDDTAKRKLKNKIKYDQNASNVNDNLNSEINAENVNVTGDNVSKFKKNKKMKYNNFEIESVSNATPTQESTVQVNLKRKSNSAHDSQLPNKKKKNKNNKNHPQGKNKEFKKFNKKSDTQNNNKSTDNPLSKLSDERLKAYGLNPKKYRSFLKYKKF